MNISIDMSKEEATAQNRIFASVVEKQTTNDGDVTLLCDFVGANYDFDNHRKISELQSKLEIAVKDLDKWRKEMLRAEAEECAKMAAYFNSPEFKGEK